MAKTQHSAPAAHDGDLMVSSPTGEQRWEMQGTRAQLEAEGAIPAGLEWPAPSTQVMNRKAAKWTAGPLRFSLQRARPAQGAGPGRQWLSGDWWQLSCCPAGRAPDWKEQEAMQAQRFARRALWELSTAGELELARCVTADMDDAFQAFKALIPALNPPRRARRGGGLAG